MKRVLFVPGVYNFCWYQYFWKKEFEKKDYEFLEFDDSFYTYWNFVKMKKMIKAGRKFIRDNPGLVVVCHSFGGVLINCILSGMKSYDVSKIVIIEGPLELEGLGMGRRKDLLKYKRGFEYDCDVVSFGGFVDEFVPFCFTRYRFGKHFNIWADHMSVLLFPWTVRKVMKISGL